MTSSHPYHSRWVERDWSEPDRIVGELLQPGGVHALQQLGLADCLAGIDAIPNEGYVIFHGETRLPLVYPHLRSIAADNNHSTLDKVLGFGFHHGKFITKLRQACQQESRIRIVEATVNRLLSETVDSIECVTGVQATLKHDKTQCDFHAPLTFVADGCFSKFRSEIGHNTPLVRSHFVGAILRDCPMPAPNHGHVILAQPSPILLYQIGTHDTRILVDVPGKVPSASTGALKNYMLNHVLPQLPTPCQRPFQEAVNEQRLRLMPNSYLPAIQNQRPGMILLGDALNMRHPLTGGGMTVAFCDTLLLTRLLKPLSSFHDTHQLSQLTRQFALERGSHSTAINVLAQALYELFSAGDSVDLNLLQEATVGYLSLGSLFERHPVGLLAGLIQQPIVLYTHFFMVAFYAIVALVLARPVPWLRHLLFTGPSAPLSTQLIHDLFSLNVLAGALLTVIQWVVWVGVAVLSAPLNLARAVSVLATASTVLLPLIWREIKF